jgi:hypothetical protein
MASAAIRRISPRLVVVAALSIGCLVAPWTEWIAAADAPTIWGWRNPLAWLAIGGSVGALLLSGRRLRGAALVIGGIALASWWGYVGWRLAQPSFSRLVFPFQPQDLIGIGWFLALVAWLLAADAVASQQSDADVGRAGGLSVALWSLVPGLGLVRSGERGRGRVWMIVAFGLAIFLLSTAAVDPNELSYANAYHSVPTVPARRLNIYVDLVIVAVIVAGSWIDTLRLQR